MRIILASTSPRRIELLTHAGVPFEMMAPHTDEIEDPRETPSAMVKRLAIEKAKAVAARLPELANTLIISADTTVVTPNGKTILAKPVDRKDALRMIRLLSGATHTVLTAYCLWVTPLKSKKSKCITRVIKTRVKIRKLSKAQCEAYIDTGESMDKAGAYGAQGKGMVLIDTIQGSYTNVVGLPMGPLMKDLEPWLKK